MLTTKLSHLLQRSLSAELKELQHSGAPMKFLLKKNYKVELFPVTLKIVFNVAFNKVVFLRRYCSNQVAKSRCCRLKVALSRNCSVPVLSFIEGKSLFCQDNCDLLIVTSCVTLALRGGWGCSLLSEMQE